MLVLSIFSRRRKRRKKPKQPCEDGHLYSLLQSVGQRRAEGPNFASSDLLHAGFSWWDRKVDKRYRPVAAPVRLINKMAPGFQSSAAPQGLPKRNKGLGGCLQPQQRWAGLQAQRKGDTPAFLQPLSPVFGQESAFSAVVEHSEPLCVWEALHTVVLPCSVTAICHQK